MRAGIPIQCGGKLINVWEMTHPVLFCSKKMCFSLRKIEKSDRVGAKADLAAKALEPARVWV
jgi:hypothetical protein